MQFQADLLAVPVLRPKVAETTALDAAYAAGLGVGFWSNFDVLCANWGMGKEWLPGMANPIRDRLNGDWKRAVTRTFDWANQGG